MQHEHDLSRSRLLSPADAASLLGVRRQRVYELVRREAIGTIRIGRLIRFKPDDLQAFLDRGGERRPEGAD